MQNEMKLESGTSNASTTVKEGLGYIITHFEGQRIWPRTISTKATENRQVVIRSIEEALARFTQANFLDCRISAYPQPSTLSAYVGVNLEIAPSIVMVDLDRETFKTQRAFETALSRILNKINWNLSNCQPTVVWSGSGYHVYLVLDASVLEKEDAFNNNTFGSNPSQKFLRFAEWFLSNGKCDPQHNNTISLRNCMLRIPGSINSKNGQKVRIVQKWNGSKSPIRYLLGSFHTWLVDQRLKLQNRIGFCKDLSSNTGKNTIWWIEHLLDTPIADYRKLAIWHILAPYLLNIRTLSYDESFSIIRRWLDECGNLRKLDFNPGYKIKGALNGSRGFRPASCERLRVENEGFYNLLQENGVLTK